MKNNFIVGTRSGNNCKKIILFLKLSKLTAIDRKYNIYRYNYSIASSIALLDFYKYYETKLLDPGIGLQNIKLTLQKDQQELNYQTL